VEVFITGIAGFLGSRLAKEMLDLGYNVAGCDNLIGGYSDNVPLGAAFYVVDCNNLDELKDVMGSPDVVYHCACTAYEGLSVFSPHLVVNNTVSASTAVFSAAVQNEVKRVIYCSSMARYGANKTPFTEDMPPMPQDPYGIAKVASEQVLKVLADINGFEYVIIVPHNIFGVGQKYDDPYRNVVAIMLNLMLQDRQPIIYGDGEQMRCFSPIHDVLPPMIEVATNKALDGSVVNIGPDDNFITINQLARDLADMIGLKLDSR
jgi:UDP-glucose 4-epimerase